MYVCVNYRPNTSKVQMPGACLPHQCQVIADLYDENGFYRSAVIADMRNAGHAAAIKFCKQRNNNHNG